VKDFAANPKVSVILPVHNGGTTLAAAIRSVLDQSYTNFELLILENGSSDNSLEISKSFDDPRVKCFELGPVGFRGALQAGLENSQAEYIARMDADDLCLPTRLQTQVDFLDKNPDYDLVGTNYLLMTPFNHLFNRDKVKESRDVTIDSFNRPSKYPYQRKFFADPSICYRKSAAMRHGGYDENFSNLADIAMSYQLLFKGKGYEIKEPHFLYRITPKSLSQSDGFYEEAHELRKKYAPQYAKDWKKPNNKGTHNEALSYWTQIAQMEYSGKDKSAMNSVLKEIKKLHLPFKTKLKYRLKYSFKFFNSMFTPNHWIETYHRVPENEQYILKYTQ